MIDENSKLLCENNELVDDEISPTPLRGTPNMSTKNTNKISDIVLNDIKKDLMGHVNIEVENLKALIDNEFTTIGRSIGGLERKNIITENTYRIFEKRGVLSKKRKYN